MPTMPSGRRVELSPDRFIALLPNLDVEAASAIFHALQEPNDILSLLDVIFFSTDDETPYFANYLASDWESNVDTWSEHDRTYFRNWLQTEQTQKMLRETLESLKGTMDEMQFFTSSTGT
jgi:hypothetical protein